LALVSAFVTFEAQRRGGAVAGTEALPVGQRIANALVSTATYLGKACVPTDLAIFYPYPSGGIPPWKLLTSSVVVGGLTILALLWIRTRPWIALGWAWFLVTLLPVIGLVQVGEQSMADRYTYLPFVGPSLALALEAPRLLGNRVPIVLGLGAALVWIGLTRAQTALWRDDETLFRHAATVVDRNWLAHYRLGFALGEQDRDEEALAQYQAALAIRPNYADPYNNIGQLQAKLGRPAEALASYDRALALVPDLAPAHGNRGNALDDLNRFPEAEQAYREALRIDPELAEVHNDFGVALAKQGRYEEGIVELREAIRRKPRYGSAYLNLSRAQHEFGRLDEAIESLREGVRLLPERADARATLNELIRMREAARRTPGSKG
jgi:Tfp pilus assembly protein PilF